MTEVNYRPHDPDWRCRYRDARDRLTGALPEGSDVEHVGSTAVDGLGAKDCVDILVVVAPGRLDDAVAAAQRLGYDYRPQSFAEDSGRAFLRRVVDGRRTHHVHILVRGHPQIAELLAFRDYLRAHPEARDEYDRCKRQLASAAPADRAAYIAGKADVVRRLLSDAMADRVAGERGQ